MEEDSPPRKGPGDENNDEKFPHYICPRRADAKKVELPKKANTILVAPRIPQNVLLLMNIMSNIVKLTIEDFDTRQQEGLKREDNMVSDQPNPTRAQVLMPMQWVEGVGCIGLINMLFIQNFDHGL